MTPWYAKVFFIIPILFLLFLAVLSGERQKKLGEKTFLSIALVGAILTLSSLFFVAHGEMVLSGTAQAKTAKEAIELAKETARASIPPGLKNREFRIVEGGGVLDNGPSGIHIVKTKNGYQATVTIEVDEYAFDKP